jgi:hypothetical protein
MSSFAEKTLDFDITIEHEVSELGYIKNELHDVKNGKQKEQDKNDPLENLKTQVSNGVSINLAKIARYQRLLSSKEHRNFSVVAITESRMVGFAILESALIVAFAFGQIYVIKNFFSKEGRRRV